MSNNDFTRNTIEAAIRLGLLLLLATWCFKIITPFIVPVVWGVIIAVAVYPLFVRLKAKLGERNKLATILYTLVMLVMLLIPAVMVSNSIVDSSATIAKRYEKGELKIPPPETKVKEWPLIGEQSYSLWSQASENLQATITRYDAEVKEAGKVAIAGIAGAAGTILQFALSIIISGVLMANAAGAYDLTIRFFSRLTSPSAGKNYTDLAKSTIRSVALGVLGVALIQAVMSALGMIIMDVPAWGLWTITIMVLAIAQLPPILVLAFVCAYVFTVADTTPASIFLVYCLIISASDSFLKPLFLGRGMKTPMLVILLGAIGGMMMSGIIGLFVGAIVLALGYELFIAWLDEEKETVQQT